MRARRATSQPNSNPKSRHAADERAPLTAAEAARLFADLKRAPALLLAVSGGPDSTALMWLAARWRGSLQHGPELFVATVDHGLRPEAAREAREVKRMARELELPHRTLRWEGPKPRTGVSAAAREARYGLLLQHAGAVGASHLLVGHTRDDQAETVLMRLLRGSGINGLCAMPRLSRRGRITLARPFLDIPKSRLVATLERAKIGFAQDPSNDDPAYLRPRLRALLPALAAEGGDVRALARLASRAARANAALEILADGAERFLALRDGGASAEEGRPCSFDALAFAVLPEEIRLRLLLRAIDRVGNEGPAELGKVETLLSALEAAMSARGPRGGGRDLKQTLAGALITLANGRLQIEAAPPRRSRRSARGQA